MALSKEQFFQAGFAERKLLLILDIYDFIKKAKRAMKIETGLKRVTDGPYASDIPCRTYEVINHRKGEAIKCEFKMNATLQKGSVTVVYKTDLPKDGSLIQGHRFNQAHYEKAIIGDESVYSLRRHQEERKVRSTKKRQARKVAVVETINEETSGRDTESKTSDQEEHV